jgi:prepilin-type N-terminal cleavage/methylation domain-containing protein
MKMNSRGNFYGVGRVTLCAPSSLNSSGAHRVTRPTFKRQCGFTMIEIAISLAVIAFALVAIIGVLPTGMNVQKDNREDTIINQDGPYWLEAIRTGARGLDYLTNHVDIVTWKRVGKDPTGIAVDRLTTYTNDPPNAGLYPIDGSMTNGERIIGLLSVPKYEGELPNRITNTVTAQVRGLSGAAVEQGKANPDFSFDYLLTSEIVSFEGGQVPVLSTNFMERRLPPLTAAEIAERQAKWLQVKSREKNTSEVRLIFRWPLLPNGQTGPGRQSFRALAIGNRVNINNLLFFQPQSFTVAELPPPKP